MKTKKLQLFAATAALVLLTSGCSALAGQDSEADAAACESLVSLTSPENLDLTLLDTANLAGKIRSTAAPLAGQDFSTKIEALAGELEKDPVDTVAIAPIAAELALRCAVVGVTFDFTNVTNVLG